MFLINYTFVRSRSVVNVHYNCTHDVYKILYNFASGLIDQCLTILSSYKHTYIVSFERSIVCFVTYLFTKTQYKFNRMIFLVVVVVYNNIIRKCFIPDWQGPKLSTDFQTCMSIDEDYNMWGSLLSIFQTVDGCICVLYDNMVFLFPE